MGSYLKWVICSGPLRCWTHRWNHRVLWVPTRVGIKPGRISPTLGINSESLAKAMPLPTSHMVEMIKGHLHKQRQRGA